MTVQTIDIDLPKELFSTGAAEHFDGRMCVDKINLGPDTYTLPHPIRWSVDLNNTGEGIYVHGTSQTEAETECARCLDDVHLDLAGEIEGYYLFDPDSIPEGLDTDEYEIIPDDHVIDIGPLIYASILIELPLVPLCRPDCKGLCASCGTNLNYSTCDCENKNLSETKSGSPFDVLKTIKWDDNGENDGESKA
ncbi:MAG: DUF177 domain-containing protein [Eggerthellaceae bacterium]|nr:DUF177 domain-containing protein [Eggerthellaceae bacterium]